MKSVELLIVNLWHDMERASSAACGVSLSGCKLQRECCWHYHSLPNKFPILERTESWFVQQWKPAVVCGKTVWATFSQHSLKTQKFCKVYKFVSIVLQCTASQVIHLSGILASWKGGSIANVCSACSWENLSYCMESHFQKASLLERCIVSNLAIKMRQGEKLWSRTGISL